MNSIKIYNFHQVAEKFDKRFHTPGTFTLAKDFEKIIVGILSQHKIIDILEAFHKLTTNDLNGSFACITVDDGDIGILKIAEIANNYRIPISFYINSSYAKGESVDPFAVVRYIVANDEINLKDKKNLESLAIRLRNTPDKIEYLSIKNYILNMINPTLKKLLSTRYATLEELKKLQYNNFQFGLHGDEHDRFIHLNDHEKKESLMRNISFLNELKNSVEIFAIPFGRKIDWCQSTLDMAKVLNLKCMSAEGGHNTEHSNVLNRMPSDSYGKKLNVRLCGYMAKLHFKK